jgi:hypothetical protein
VTRFDPITRAGINAAADLCRLQAEVRYMTTLAAQRHTLLLDIHKVLVAGGVGAIDPAVRLQEIVHLLQNHSDLVSTGALAPAGGAA